MSIYDFDEELEKFLTIAQVAKALGLPPYKIRRAAKAKLFPTYRFYNGRVLLKLSEVVAAIEATREGGVR